METPGYPIRYLSSASNKRPHCHLCGCFCYFLMQCWWRHVRTLLPTVLLLLPLQMVGWMLAEQSSWLGLPLWLSSWLGLPLCLPTAAYLPLCLSKIQRTPSNILRTQSNILHFLSNILRTPSYILHTPKYSMYPSRLSPGRGVQLDNSPRQGARAVLIGCPLHHR